MKIHVYGYTILEICHKGQFNEEKELSPEGLYLGV